MEKIIHAIWLGGKKTKLAEKCRASWEKFAPEWEIREWGPDISGLGFAEGRVPRFTEEALKAKKWAFASDWLRFAVLEREGGIYFDYDVELVAPFVPPEGEWCAGEWLKDGSVGMNPGAGIALEKGSEVARRMLEIYGEEGFDGKTTVGDLMSKNGVRIRMLEPEVMCPYDWEHKLHRSTRTLAIHHYALSWITPRRRIAKWLAWHGMGKFVDFLVKLKNE